MHYTPERYAVNRDQWTVPRLSIMFIYNGSRSKLIQWIRMILSGDKLTKKIQNKSCFLFVINLITSSKKMYRIGRSLKMYETMHYCPRSTYTLRIMSLSFLCFKLLSGQRFYTQCHCDLDIWPTDPQIIDERPYRGHDKLRRHNIIRPKKCLRAYTMRHA